MLFYRTGEWTAERMTLPPRQRRDSLAVDGQRSRSGESPGMSREAGQSRSIVLVQLEYPARRLQPPGFETPSTDQLGDEISRPGHFSELHRNCVKMSGVQEVRTPADTVGRNCFRYFAGTSPRNTSLTSVRQYEKPAGDREPLPGGRNRCRMSPNGRRQAVSSRTIPALVTVRSRRTSVQV